MFKVKIKRKGHNLKYVEYRLNGELHRLDGPAAEWEDGTKYWYKNGFQHREDGPAIETFDGHKEWYRNGVRRLTDANGNDYV